MTSSRLKSLGKLALLLGVPVALLIGLFGAGVHCGFQHRVAILGFERDWLGMKVEVPAPGPGPSEPAPVVAAEPAPPTPARVDPPVAPVPAPPVATPEPRPDTQPEPTPGPAALVAVSEPSPLVIAGPLPLPADLQPRLAERVRVRVKVLVDAELVERRPDWIAYAQRHVAWASQVLEQQVGVHLELRGVVAWPGPGGRDAAALLADLHNRERDGVDLLIGLSSGTFVAGPAPAIGEAANLGFVLAGANPGSRAPHLRGMLRAIGEAFGATPMIGPGTFMGDVVIHDRSPIDLDADNRRRILERKGLPFMALPDAAPDEAPAAEVEAEDEEAARAEAARLEAAARHQPHRPLPSVQDRDEED